MKAELKNIKSLVASDELEQALDALSDLFENSSFARDIIRQQSRFKALRKVNNKGIISIQEATVERNKISEAILDLIDEIELFENQAQLQRRSRIFLSKYKYPFFLSLLIAISLSGFFIFQQRQNNIEKKQIQKLDREIAARIARIDIPSWYRILLIQDSTIDLQARLLKKPADDQVIMDEFKDKSLKSLIIDLMERVDTHEKVSLEEALEELTAIENKYLSGLMVKEPSLVFEFTEDLISFNNIRWSTYNQLDEEAYIRIVDTLQILLNQFYE